jgi:hypothetical protein
MLLKRNWECVEPKHQHAWTPGKILWIDGQVQVGQTAKEGAESNLAFQARKRDPRLWAGGKRIKQLTRRLVKLIKGFPF